MPASAAIPPRRRCRESRCECSLAQSSRRLSASAAMTSCAVSPSPRRSEHANHHSQNPRRRRDGRTLGFRFKSLTASYEKITREWRARNAVCSFRPAHGISATPSLKSDEIHPNARGYQILAERVSGPVKKLIAKADRSRAAYTAAPYWTFFPLRAGRDRDPPSRPTSTTTLDPMWKVPSGRRRRSRSADDSRGRKSTVRRWR